MTELKNSRDEIYYQTEGVVKSYNKETGYGFLTTMDEEEDIFLHYSNILVEGRKELNVGDNVSFFYKETNGGLKAYQVRKV